MCLRSKTRLGAIEGWGDSWCSWLSADADAVKERRSRRLVRERRRQDLHMYESFDTIPFEKSLLGTKGCLVLIDVTELGRGKFTLCIKPRRISRIYPHSTVIF